MKPSIELRDIDIEAEIAKLKKTTAYDLRGRKFGRLTPITPCGRLEKNVVWLCICDCGRESAHRACTLTQGIGKSCGCLKVEECKSRATHGASHNGVYKIWQNIKTRCTNRASIAFKYYGARGIGICSDWTGLDGFTKFRDHIGPRPSRKHSVDRINNDGNYEPGNVRWATAKEQIDNRRMKMIDQFPDEAIRLEYERRCNSEPLARWDIPWSGKLVA